MEPEIQKELEEKAYANFLKEANSVDSKIMRGIFEKSKKSLILKDSDSNKGYEMGESLNDFKNDFEKDGKKLKDYAGKTIMANKDNIKSFIEMIIETKNQNK